MPILPGPLVDADWLATHRDEVAICDTRWYLDGRSAKDAYDAGHIAGAVFVDLDTDLSAPPGPRGRHPLPEPDDFAAAMSRLGIGDDTTVVAYDDTGGIQAARMWWMLDSLGRAAAVLDGGIDSWTEPLSTEPADPPQATFTPMPWPRTRFVTADDVAGRGPGVQLLDARSLERYRGDENPIDPRFGHVPGATSAPATDNLIDGRLRPVEDLARSYAERSITADTPTIAYCGSGVSACTDLLALRLVGVEDLALYVGSWSEWGADPTRPVASDG